MPEPAVRALNVVRQTKFDLAEQMSPIGGAVRRSTALRSPPFSVPYACLWSTTEGASLWSPFAGPQPGAATALEIVCFDDRPTEALDQARAGPVVVEILRPYALIEDEVQPHAVLALCHDEYARHSSWLLSFDVCWHPG
jgi:hypothetical protein